MATLIDTNIFVAATDFSDKYHKDAVLALQRIVEVRVIPAPVLPEMFYMLTVRVGYKAAQGYSIG